MTPTSHRASLDVGADHLSVSRTRPLLRLSRPHTRARLQAADMATVKDLSGLGEFSGLSRLTHDSIRRQVDAGKLLGLKGAGLGLRLPVWRFFDPMRSAMPKNIYGLGGADPWAVLSFLESPQVQRS